MVLEMVEDSLRTLALMNETGYSIQQDNGQRIYGPPPDWIGPAPKDTEIFIGKLPNDIYEYDIVPLFSSVGKIYMLRIMQNFSGLNRGFAFVQYTTPQEADQAIRYLNNTEIRPGEKIGVVKSRNNCRLYIGKLNTSMTREEIREELEKFTEDIVDVTIHKSEMPGQNNRGYAFVEYQTHKAAAKARRKLVPCKIKIRGVEVLVDWATPLHECGEILNVFNSLLIRNIRETAKNDELCQFYSLRSKLKIVKFKRLPNKLVITFHSRDEAEKAMQIYEDLKNSKQFCYFAEKNKRVEMVWLKNNMNLSAFSSSIDYTPPKFYNNRSDCHNPAHQHVGNQQNHQTNKIIRKNFDFDANNQINYTNHITNNLTNRNQPIILNQVMLTNQYNVTNDGVQSRINENSNGKVSTHNQRFFCSNNYDSQSINDRTNDNGVASLNNNRNASMCVPNRPDSGVCVPNSRSAFESSSNTLTDRLNYINNQLGTTLGSSSTVSKNGGHTFHSNNMANRTSSDWNPFSANTFGLHNIWSSNTSNASSNLLNNERNSQTQESTNLANTSSINDCDYTERAYNHNILASFNSSFNSEIWTNYHSNNLDVSANWNKFKDRKARRAMNFTPRYGSSESSHNNISEEDTCSLKSDYESSGDSNRFNCFNAINNFNLHENLRDLNINKNLSDYPLYNPILQQ